MMNAQVYKDVAIGQATSKKTPPPPPPVPPPHLDIYGAAFFRTQRANFEPIKLHFAINKGDLEEVRMRIGLGYNLNFIIHGNTPLTLAILKDQFAIAQLLVDSGANVTTPEKAKWARQPIHLAAGIGELSLVQSLLEHGASLHAADAAQCTPLHWAANNGYLDMVKYLLDEGAHINVKDDMGRTPLHRAAENGLLPIVRLLFTEGASVNARDLYGWTPVYQCIVCSQQEMVRELLSYGASVTARDNRGETLLHIAAGRLRRPSVLTLCRTSTDFYTRHLKVATPAVLQAWECPSDDCSMVSMILEAGAEVNSRNVDGDSALRIAACEGNINIVRWLLAGGADLSWEPWIHALDWPQKVSSRSDVCEWLLQKAEVAVRPLTFLCKLTVRRSLAPNIGAKIADLPLPNKMKAYLRITLDQAEVY